MVSCTRPRGPLPCRIHEPAEEGSPGHGAWDDRLGAGPVIERRAFIAGVVGSFGHQLVAEAQPAGKGWRGGFLWGGSAAPQHHLFEGVWARARGARDLARPTVPPRPRRGGSP